MPCVKNHTDLVAVFLAQLMILVAFSYEIK